MNQKERVEFLERRITEAETGLSKQDQRLRALCKKLEVEIIKKEVEREWGRGWEYVAADKLDGKGL